ncbi:PTS sugar transporter subunit IIB, partial [Catenibacterium mitsuokai]|uniref:PTS sugar transporter subunit IIB n=1 Tax=Catenibacterium mitsuokai TaxID=100886 RepID=UPI002418A030
VRFIGMVGQPHRNFMKMASWSSVSEHLVNPIGMSDQLKWNNQNQWAEQNNEDLEVKAIPIDDYLSVYKDYDVLLVGPQMRYKIKDVQKAVTDRPSAVINPSDYALGNVENIIKEVKRMIKEGK